MFGKLFETMYDGTLVASWEALVTFQQMIVLADDVGVIDITPSALSARTGIPLRVIKKGIEILEADDPYSRSPTQNGRRIERLDDHRPWGWRIVNYMKYRQLADHQEKKKADRERIAAKRASEKANKNKGVAKCRKVSQASQPVADVAHTDTDTDTDTDKKEIDRFEECWQAWPEDRRVEKKAARRVWESKKLSAVADTILEDVEVRSQSAAWRDPKFIPHPHRYLTGERWNDVLDTDEHPRDPFEGLG